MFIQIDYANYINKGAELMLNSITDYLTNEINDAEFVFGNSWYSRKDLATSGMYKRLNLELFGYPIDKFLHGKYRKFAEKRGLVRTSEVSVVLNAAGYYYHDGSLGIFNSVKKEINYFRNLKRNKSKVILMPQAFGPLKKSDTQKMIRGVFEYVDIAFARDKLSYDSLLQCLQSDNKIRLAPDFTNIYVPKNIKIEFQQNIKNIGKYVVVVPNFNMISVLTEVGYEKFLTDVVNLLLLQNIKVVILNHESGGDRPLIRKLEKLFANRVIFMDNLSADEVKTTIINSYLTITSRFHGYVSALSSAVPALCTSWSHKYEELSRDYHVENSVLDPKNMKNAVDVINFYLNEKNNSEARNKLKEFALYEKQKTYKMWQEILEIIRK